MNDKVQTGCAGSAARSAWPLGRMSAYRDALSVDAEASEQRLALAGGILRDGDGVVLLEGILALRPTPNALLCEVIDPTPSIRRSGDEYEVLVEGARRLLEASRLRAQLPSIRREWLVVDDHGMGTLELWHAP